MSQHVSKASAAAIMKRLNETVDPLDPSQLIQASDQSLIEVGLTRAKRQTIQTLALAINQGDLDLPSVCQLTVADAIETLTSFKGIGPWTAEVFLLFCGGHIDVFPAGDVALRTAIGAALAIEPRPSIAQTRQISERWAPYRGVAARLMWAYYAELQTGSRECV